jgi:predicted amidohydrolase YtcJ
MPPIGTLLLLSSFCALFAIVYQNPEPILKPIIGSLAFKIVQQLFEETRCYVTVRTNSVDLPHAECFSIKNGKFKRVFLDETSFDVVKEARTGHVIPGLWDGHGHLNQLGELKNSVDLFGADSMIRVKDRLLEYRKLHEEAGSSERWLRGVGWDQANFNGKWPEAVRNCPVQLLSDEV